jgi:uncharacterized protein YjiS (DUF1127 family)
MLAVVAVQLVSAVMLLQQQPAERVAMVTMSAHSLADLLYTRGQVVAVAEQLQVAQLALAELQDQLVQESQDQQTVLQVLADQTMLPAQTVDLALHTFDGESEHGTLCKNRK